MTRILSVGFMAFCLAFAAGAEAAKPKKTRQASRIGAYAGASIGMSNYSSDQSGTEAELVVALENAGDIVDGPEVETEDSPIGYQAAFGYRFTRYLAFEIGLADYGELTSKGSATYDEGGGPFPLSFTVGFDAQGPVISAIGILPLNEKFELYARAGLMFASSERSVTTRVDGERGPSGTAQGDSQELVIGAGAAFNFNQAYSIRVEYQRVGDVGQEDRTGIEELSAITAGLYIRF